MDLFPWERLSVVVHSAGVYTECADWSIPFRQNPFTALWCLTEGRIRLHFGSDSVTAVPGDVLIIPTNIPFRAEYSAGCNAQQTIAVRFNCHSPEQLDWFTLFRLPYRVAADYPIDAVRQLLDIVELTKPNAPPLGRMKANGLLLRLLADLLQPFAGELTPIDTPHNAKRAKVMKLIRWMDEHLTERITVTDLAKVIHVSSDYVTELFRSVTGEPPIHYLNRMRIDKAKRLLLERELSVKEISTRVGFSDSLYFSKTFRKLVGIPPSRYESVMHKL